MGRYGHGFSGLQVRGFMKRHFKFIGCAVALFLAQCSLPVSAVAQRVSPRSTALDQADSRAELEAEQMVALSADKIITILRQEPGLLLEVKKVLVRKAYEQGRLLDSVDLTDDAIFQLLREDQNVRVLATQQIEDRNYIRAKPTREEIARDLGARETPPPGSSPTGQGSEEADYWTKRAASETEQRSLRSSQQPVQQPLTRPQCSNSRSMHPRRKCRRACLRVRSVLLIARMRNFRIATITRARRKTRQTCLQSSRKNCPDY